MADPDLSVRFGGDTSSLSASIAQARAALAAFAPGATGPAKAGLDALAASLAKNKIASDVANGGWRENLISLAALESLTRTTRDAYESYAASVLKAQYATASFIVQQERSALIWYAQASVKGLDWSTQALGIQAAASALGDYGNSSAYAERGARLFAQANDGVVASTKQAFLAVGDFVERLKLRTQACRQRNLPASRPLAALKASSPRSTRSAAPVPPRARSSTSRRSCRRSPVCRRRRHPRLR